MIIEGSNGSIEVLGDNLTIRHKGFANFLTQGLQGEKAIPLANITAVQFKAAGGWMAGYIQFTLLGGREFRGGALEATKDENAVMFDRKQQPGFERLRDHVQATMSKPAVAGNPVDELSKLADLVEKGFLTRAEFDARKATIFGN